MNLQIFFPTIVGNVHNPNHDEIQDELVGHCLSVKQNVKSGGEGWLSSKTFNTSNGRYEIIKDSKFTMLNLWVEQQIKIYCEKLNIHTEQLVNNGSWFNIYNKYDFQEVHVHPTSMLSAIYILKCEEDGARVFFRTPVNEMYFIHKDVKRQEMADQIIYSSIPGNLLIFPSYLKHGVERHESDEMRISLSYNYRN